MKTIILFLSLLIYPASVLLADPSYCLDLHGVKVTIKDGSRLTGRIVWCSRYFEDFNDIYTGKTSPSVGDYIKNNGWNIESYRGDESYFTKWIELVNFVLKQKVSYPERLTYNPLTLCKKGSCCLFFQRMEERAPSLDGSSFPLFIYERHQ